MTNFRLVFCNFSHNAMIFINKNGQTFSTSLFKNFKDHNYDKFGYIELIKNDKKKFNNKKNQNNCQLNVLKKCWLCCFMNYDYSKNIINFEEEKNIFQDLSGSFNIQKVFFSPHNV